MKHDFTKDSVKLSSYGWYFFVKRSQRMSNFISLNILSRITLKITVMVTVVSLVCWGETWVQLARWPLFVVFYQPRMIDDVWSSRNENCQEKPKYLEKTCPGATLSTTDPTWPDLGSNSGRRDGKPTTNRLSYGASRVQAKSYKYTYIELL
jgi:hypothetical protein